MADAIWNGQLCLERRRPVHAGRLLDLSALLEKSLAQRNGHSLAHAHPRRKSA